MAAIAVSLGSLIVGFSSGYTSPALPSMKEANATSFTFNESQVIYLRKDISFLDINIDFVL